LSGLPTPLRGVELFAHIWVTSESFSDHFAVAFKSIWDRLAVLPCHVAVVLVVVGDFVALPVLKRGMSGGRKDMCQRSMMASIFVSFQNEFKVQPPAAHVGNVDKILSDKITLFKEGCPRKTTGSCATPRP